MCLDLPTADHISTDVNSQGKAMPGQRQGVDPDLGNDIPDGFGIRLGCWSQCEIVEQIIISHNWIFLLINEVSSRWRLLFPAQKSWIKLVYNDGSNFN